MNFEWITPEQAATQWGVSTRRVQAICIKGQIKGVIKIGRAWFIHKDTLKPSDGRARNGRKPTKHEQE